MAILINNKDAEVWSYHINIHGQVDDADLTEIAVINGGNQTPFAPRNGYFEIKIPLHEGNNIIQVFGRKVNNEVIKSNSVQFWVPLGRFAHGAELPSVTEDRPLYSPDKAAVYGICVHLLSRKGLAGVTAELPRIVELGCNTIWLNPIFPSHYGSHGYDVIDYFSVRPDYGTIADLRELTYKAHYNNLRVLLDLVPNHTSEHHPYFVDAIKNGEGSHYHNFYLWKRDGHPRHYFHWTGLPNLNYDHEEVRRMMFEVGRFWVDKIGIDGFRIDVAWGIQERNPGFWREWSSYLRHLYPHLLLIAEAPARWPCYFEEGFNAAYDWDEGFLPAWRELFTAKSNRSEIFHHALRGGNRGFHPCALVLRFVDNNDTGARFYSRYGPETARLACLLICTLPGIPLIYMGQENGAVYEPYGEEQEPILPGTDLDLQRLYQRLLRLRSKESSLTGDHWKRLIIKPGENAYAFLRFKPGARPSIVVVNLSSEAGHFRIEHSLGGKNITYGKITDYVFGTTADLDDEYLELELGAYGSGVFFPSAEI